MTSSSDEREHEERPARSEVQPDHGEAPRPVRRRHRRVDAPGTNAAADSSDDLPAGSSSGTPPAPAPADAQPVVDGPPDGGRDAWIRAQRPPHWD